MGFGIRRRLLRRVDRFLFDHEPVWLRGLRMFLAPPQYPGARLTRKRLLNCYRSRWEMRYQTTRVRSLPLKLTVEPINTCNLGCPACFTGDGQVSRPRKTMPLDLYRRLLDEMGDCLFQVEFCNWGEPLLNKQIGTMIREATDRGIGTVANTNFSFPFDDARAEELVTSGLTILGVSIDGARQETYEQYRVGGDLATVLDNCRKVRDAKRRLGAQTPQMIWAFHIFPHNVFDVEPAKAMARELEMGISMEKGWLVGEEWERDGFFHFKDEIRPFPCLFLWNQTVVNSDGGVAPCCGTFYREDDMGQLALAPGTPGATTFREVWNGERFRQAREMYHSRASSAAKDHVCYDCPATIIWERWRAHEATGGDLESFDPGFTPNDNFNYFWNRRPPGAAPPRRRVTMGTR
ncbi:MAG: radical SAM protein [Candidatus Binatia bacterium]